MMFTSHDSISFEELRDASPEEPSSREASPSHAADSAPQPQRSAPRERARTAPNNNSCLNLYLTEIGQVKLLTPQEEIELAARIKNGDEQAREQMIKANLRLVVKIARDYENIGLPLLDLISEGNIGLMKAVERFDPSFGAKLSTYASWWIKQSIKRALANQSKTIRLPCHMVEKISKMHRADRHLHAELGREPTDEELADELGIKTHRVTQMRVASIKPSSLDAPIGDNESGTFGDMVTDENAQSPYQKFEGAASISTLRHLVGKLAPREAAILTARFGLDGAPQQSLEEVGVKFDVTRERVRQLQNRALNRLRKHLEKLDRPSTSSGAQ